MPIKTHWEGVYRTKREDEVSWFQAEPAVSLRLIDELGLPPESRVLDVGGGASRLVDMLLDAGYERPGVLDVAKPGLDQARERLGRRADRVEWIVVDVKEYQPEHLWNVWHDRAVFHFLSSEQDRTEYRRSLNRALAPGGHAVLETFGPEGPESCSGLPVVRYGPEALDQTLGPGYALRHSGLQTHVTPSGSPQQFLHCVFERVGAPGEC